MVIRLSKKVKSNRRYYLTLSTESKVEPKAFLAWSSSTLFRCFAGFPISSDNFMSLHLYNSFVQGWEVSPTNHKLILFVSFLFLRRLLLLQLRRGWSWIMGILLPWKLAMLFTSRGGLSNLRPSNVVSVLLETL